ncbi:3,4-dihydroxyphenylacetate 2,3-dioxygenase [Rhodobacter ferrooxidans]|uniref:3,4-dihydroxyphenylacetate 2,3-dioxygenase n=1 Tax=Rhodobacter ferrooxidans TaxID=371731 RepID=C8RX97_9RHOB|nr:3,4-dihydroxyphenylacetate 2,3-dioxygenase [Rhodobacter sp. SW2]EEW26622.1 3,4-dihydroxyphenylacetate 2,3-dioxygenase [Rhodobacter sp. SW2]
MGIVLAAKVTHVPTIWMSHTMEKYRGIRQPAIDGYARIREQAIAAGVETFVVFDTHWIVNQGFHLNARPQHQGRFTSHELPHMLADMDYGYDGDSELARMIADEVRASGQKAMAHETPGLGMEYGTLLPMHFINQGAYARVVPVAVNQFASIAEHAAAGAALARAVAASGRRVGVLASGSLSHAFWPNDKSEAGINSLNGEFNRQSDLRVLELWAEGRWPEFLAMLPDYAGHCSGECGMGDTALLFGALGWEGYKGQATVQTPYFPSSGTGQTNVTFSV